MTANTISLRFPEFRILAARLLTAVLLAGAGVAAVAQDEMDPPGRVGRITHAEGAVSFAEAGGNDWTNAQTNRPLTRGDRLWVDRGARSEAHIGSAAVRMGALTHVEILALDDEFTQLNLTQGSLSVRIREMVGGERFEIGTPNLAFSLSQPGEYRIDVDPAGDTTRVAVHSGAGTVYGENRETANIAAQQQVSFSGRNLAQAGANAWLQRDAFDQWSADRDRLEDQSVAARYVSREVIGYQQLDTHGEWRSDAQLGPVWFPRVTVADWAPYRYGHWSWIAPWGWTWIDDAPWGFAPFHYGRWTQVGPRWGWVPGPRSNRPVYAPALVAFVGGNGGGANWSISLGAGSPGVAWFPLGPGDAYRPGYRASRRYFDNLNRGFTGPQRPADFYANQRRPGAVTAISADDFGRGRNSRNFQRVPDGELARARVVEPPPIPGRGFGPRERPAPARALPPTTVLNQPAPPSNVRPEMPGRFGGGGRDGNRGGTPPEANRGTQAPQPAIQQPAQPPAQVNGDRSRAGMLQRAQAERDQAQQRDQAQRQQNQQAEQQRQQQMQQAQQAQQQESARRQAEAQEQRNRAQQRQAQDQNERAQRQQQEGQQRVQREQQERAQRQQQEAQQRQQRDQQQGAQRQQQMEAQRAAAMQQQRQQQQQARPQAERPQRIEGPQRAEGGRPGGGQENRPGREARPAPRPPAGD